ncbi:MAG: nucleoside monophosphate kinase [Candidatus Micrarchaeia archaeon]
MVIVFIGAPLSGKSFQARKISDKLGFNYISVGDLLRTAVKVNKDLAEKIKSYLDAGDLVPDYIVNNLLRVKLGQVKGENVVIDGYPRTEQQAWFLERIAPPDLVFIIDLDNEEVLARAEGRRYCPKCQRVYNLNGFPKPAKDEVCDDCNVRLEKREDDSIEVVKKRLEIYHATFDDLKEYYNDRCFVLQGALNPDDLENDITDLIFIYCVNKEL